jgi:hypothetical protein
MSINWSSAAEKAIQTGLNQIPEVGGILSALVGIFWPQGGEDVWDEIRAKVDAEIKNAITDAVYAHVKTKLGSVANRDGLIGVMLNYNRAVQEGQEAEIQSKWAAADDIFVNDAAVFEQEGYETGLLAMFAQMANMHLLLRRDGVLKGFILESDLASRTELYSTYANKWLAKAVTSDPDFNVSNKVARFFQLNVGNFVNLWPYFDPVKYPSPVKNIPSPKEIFYTVTESVPGNIPAKNYTPPGTKEGLVTEVNVAWLQDNYDSYNFVIGTQLNYESGSQAYSGILVNHQPPTNGEHSPVFPDSMFFYIANVPVAADDPITSVSGGYNQGAAVYSVQFGFQKGDKSGVIPWAQTQDYLVNYTIQPPEGYVLSSIWVPAAIGYYNGARDMVFGFKTYPSGIGA